MVDNPTFGTINGMQIIGSYIGGPRREFKTIDVSVYVSADEIIKHLAEQDSDGWWWVSSIRQEHTSVAKGGEFIRLMFARTVKAE